MRACEVSGVCGVCVGMAAVLKKEQNVDSAARTTQTHPRFHSAPACRLFHRHALFTCLHFSVGMFHFNEQIQKTGTEMASRQEPREQGRG